MFTFDINFVIYAVWVLAFILTYLTVLGIYDIVYALIAIGKYKKYVFFVSIILFIIELNCYYLLRS